MNRTCPHCGTTFTQKRKFCSNKCVIDYRIQHGWFYNEDFRKSGRGSVGRIFRKRNKLGTKAKEYGGELF
jgi:hypothetical protein